MTSHPNLSRPLALAFSLVALVASACSTPSTGAGPGYTLPDGAGIGDTGNKDAKLSGDATSTEDDSGFLDDATDSLSDTLVDLDTPTPQDGYDGPSCTKNAACKDLPGTPYCAIAIAQCVECLVPLHCAATTNNCQNYKCVEVSCVPGSKQCNGASYLDTCKPDGKGFDTEACPDATPSCINSECRVCQPGKTFCGKAPAGQTQSKTVLKCNDAGTATQIVEECSGDQVCNGTKCQACTPGTKVCDSDKAMVCKGDGSGFDLAQDCGAQGWSCTGGVCLNPCSSDIKSNTNVGCDYWAVDLDNAYVPCSSPSGFCDAQNAQFSVIISNTKDKPATVTVLAGTGQKATYTVPGGQIKILNLPDPSWKGPDGKTIPPLNQDGTNINKNAYRISSSQPIVAYQFNPLANVDVFSNDASLLLPSNGIGNEYWVMTREQSVNELKSYLTIVATQPDKTHVKLVSSAKTLPGPGIPAMSPGETREFDLNQGEVLNIETNFNGADPTGSYIKADKAVAVFGGSEASNSPNTDHCVNGTCQFQGWACATNDDCPKTCCSDHMEEQLFPVSSWGTKYLATKLQPRGKEKDAWRVLAATDGTVVTLDPPQLDDKGQTIAVPMLGQGEWFEFESSGDFVISANNPIEVGQFMASADAPNPNNDVCTANYLGGKVCTWYWNVQMTPLQCAKNAQCPNMPEAGDAKTGDPDFVLGVASEQYLTDYVFLVPDKYTANYVNVIVPTGATATIDGTLVAAASFSAVSADWSVARLPIKPGAHKLLGSKPIGLIVYGYSDYVSYSYPGGVALK